MSIIDGMEKNTTDRWFFRIHILGLMKAFYLKAFTDRSVMWFLVGNQIIFCMSQGYHIWVFISEIFQMLYGQGQALGSFTHGLVLQQS